MIDGGKVVAKISNMEICLYEAMRDLAAQFAAGDMTIDVYLDSLERLTDDAKKMEVTDGNNCDW